MGSWCSARCCPFENWLGSSHSPVCRCQQVTYLPVQSDGMVDLQQLKDAIRPETAIVSIMMVNNEIGGSHTAGWHLVHQPDVVCLLMSQRWCSDNMRCLIFGLGMHTQSLSCRMSRKVNLYAPNWTGFNPDPHRAWHSIPLPLLSLVVARTLCLRVCVGGRRGRGGGGEWGGSSYFWVSVTSVSSFNASKPLPVILWQCSMESF